MFKTIAKLFAAKPAPIRMARKSLRVKSLRVESLEDRSVPAVIVQPIGDTLMITGDDTDNHVVINQANFWLTVDVYGDAPGQGHYYFGLNTYEVARQKIEVALKGGNDTLEYINEDFDVMSARTLAVDLGDGNDTTEIDFFSPSGLISAPLAVSVVGGKGNDNVTAAFPRFRFGSLDFAAYLGDDNDTAKVSLQGDLTYQASVSIKMYGQNGADSLFVGTSDLMSTDNGGNGVFGTGSQDCPLNVQLWGGDGNDIVRANLDGSFGDVVNLTVGGDGGRYDTGSDRVQALITLRDGSYGRVNASVYGGAGNDYLQLDYTGAGINQADKNFLIDGGLGTLDRVVTPSSTVFISILNCEGTCPSIWYIPGL